MEHYALCTMPVQTLGVELQYRVTYMKQQIHIFFTRQSKENMKSILQSLSINKRKGYTYTYFTFSILYRCIYGCMLYMLLFNFVNNVFLLLYLCILIVTFCSVYSVSLCCSVYCLCVNVYCATATGCQPNCSYKYIILSGCYMFRLVDILRERTITWPPCG
jgi:hypothetical protein